MNAKYFILFGLIWSILSYGQVSIMSETNTKEYEVNKPFTLNIGVEIEGDLHPQTPLKLPDLSKFEILGNASEIFTFIDEENSSLVRQIVYQLIVEPKQSGKIKIGSALLQVNGKIYKSEPFDIVVKDIKKRENTLNKEVYLSMESLNDNYYENEPIKIIIKAYGKNFHHFRKLHKVRMPQHIGNIYPIHLKHQDIEMGQNAEDMASQVIASFWVFPDQQGNITIPPAIAHLENEKLRSNSLKINTKSLPKNAPNGFRNAVGDFDLEIYSPQSSTEINQGIEIFVKLSGSGNLDKIELPKILESNDYQIFKPTKTIRQNTYNGILHGEIIEHYILIPQKQGNILIALEDFAFFNPKTKDYHQFKKTLKLDIKDSISKKENENNIEKIIENTGHILKKVDLVPKPQKEEESTNILLVFLCFSSLFLGIMGLILWNNSRKKTKKINKYKEKHEKITTIAETEDLLKGQINIDNQYQLKMLKNAMMNNNAVSFFELYEELHQNIEKQIFNKYKKHISEYLSEKGNPAFAQEYETFREVIQTEKYSPMHQNLEEFYKNIDKFYSKIIE